MTETTTPALVVTTPSDREIVLTRTFAAPAALVFKVWTTPDHVRRWWGLRGSDMVVCDIDLRVGGAWRYVSREADGSEVAFRGEYSEVVEPTRLVHTEIFELFPDHPSTITTTFEERDGRTTVVSTCCYDSTEVRDMVLGSGMEFGAAESYDRIEELLATLR